MPLKLRQMRGGTLGLAIGTVEIDRCRRIGSVPGPVIAGIDPQPAGLGAAAAGIEHRDRRVVGEQRLRGEDVLGEPAPAAAPATSTAPPTQLAERRAVQLDALPGEDLALPIERKVIAVLGDQHMSRAEPGSPGPWRSAAPAQGPDGSSRRPGSHSAAGRCG